MKNFSRDEKILATLILGTFGVIFFALAATGCAKKGPVLPQTYMDLRPAPTPAPPPTAIPPLPTPVPTLVAAVKKQPMETHTIRQGDTMWALSASKYGTGLAWPLVWRANRHFVPEPDWLEIGEDLKIPQGNFSSESLDWAVGVSGQWPRHPTPRD